MQIKKPWNKLKGGEKGQTLIVALILMLVGALFITPMLSYTGSGLKAVKAVHETRMDELYAADAGVEDAIWKMMNIPNISYPYGPYQTDNINGKVVTVTAENFDDIVYKVTSTATTDNSSDTTIVAHLMRSFSIFDFAAAALNGDLKISGNTLLTSWPEENEANIYANGSITVKGGATVEGDAIATGSVTVTGGSEITGNITEYSPPLQIMPVNMNPYRIAAMSGNTIPGDYMIQEDIELGNTHITGSLSITSDATVNITGTVWVDGEISMHGQSVVKGGGGLGTLVAVGDAKVTGGGELVPDEYPFIVSTEGNITTAGDQTVYAVLYAPNGLVKVGGKAGVDGAAIGKEVSIETSSRLSYPFEFSSSDNITSLHIVSWEINLE